MIQARKQHYMWAFGQIGELFLGMMGQMIREERTISQIGPKGQQQLLQVHPLDLQGEFDVNDQRHGRVHRPPGEALRGDGADEPVAGVGPAMADQPAGPSWRRCWSPTGSTTRSSSSTPRSPRRAPPAPPGTPQGAAGMQEGMAPGPMPVGSQGQTNPDLAAQMGGQGGRTRDVA